MILITGSILAREDWFGDVGRSCLERVERSRKEPGSSRMMCMSTAGTRCGGRFEGVRKIPRGPDRRNLGRQDISGQSHPEMEGRGRLVRPGIERRFLMRLFQPLGIEAEFLGHLEKLLRGFGVVDGTGQAFGPVGLVAVVIGLGHGITF